MTTAVGPRNPASAQEDPSLRDADGFGPPRGSRGTLHGLPVRRNDRSRLARICLETEPCLECGRTAGRVPHVRSALGGASQYLLHGCTGLFPLFKDKQSRRREGARSSKQPTPFSRKSESWCSVAHQLDACNSPLCHGTSNLGAAPPKKRCRRHTAGVALRNNHYLDTLRHWDDTLPGS